MSTGPKVGRAGKKDNANATRDFRLNTEIGIFRAVSDSPRLKEPYVLARCCSPGEADEIVGYHSHDTGIKVHRTGCANLNRAEQDRLVSLVWADILAPDGFQPEADYEALEPLDFRIMAHHEAMGLDYSAVVARALQVSRSEAFERHKKLRTLGLIERVEKLMIQYRKGIVDNKWIKHRNHTYYDLTDKGRAYLAYHRTQGPDAAAPDPPNQR